MLIIWGTRVARQTRGFVADVCPRCGQPRPFKVVRLRKYSHLYFVPVSRSKDLGEVMACRRCQMETAYHPGRYAELARKPGRSIDDLIAQTHPALPDRLAEQRAADLQAASGELSDEERCARIAEVLGNIAADVEKRAGQAHIDGKSGLAIVANLVLIPTVWMIATDQPAASQPGWQVLAWATTIGLPALLIYLLVTDVGRYIRRVHHKHLSRSLMWLYPTVEELEQVRQAFRARGDAVGKKLRPTALHAAIEQQIDRDAAGG